jgi:hypothetical protein
MDGVGGTLGAPPRRQLAIAGLCAALVLALAGLGTVALLGNDEPAVKPLPRSLPYGKGMWIWQVRHTEGGDADAIVDRAKKTGLSHIYVRMGSSWDGFTAGPFLDELLPEAHAEGIRVYGWDFPRLLSVPYDVARASAAATYRTPEGHGIDGFAADIETAAEGTNITALGAAEYGEGLRQAVGTTLPLIAVVPRPSASRPYPYAAVVEEFDAIAPMVYWLNREPGADVAGAMRDLRGFEKPVFPIGQAYDGEAEGGRRGVPPRAELLRFVDVAAEYGAAGVSFWSWQAANQEAWDAIAEADAKFGRPE